MLPLENFVKLDTQRSLLRSFLAYVLQLLANIILIVITHLLCEVRSDYRLHTTYCT